MHDDLDTVVVEAEEEVRLDELEPLVRKRCRVDRDLRAHAPRGVRQRSLDGHAFEVGAREPAKRPAGRRQDERRDRLRVAALEALEGGRVLAVDRQQQPSSPLPGRERELSRRDEALLVGERQRDPALERPERRRQPGEPDDRVQDDVWLRALEQLGRVAADLGVRREAVDRL
jgi:hypothetical protein